MSINTSLQEQKDFILSNILYDLHCYRNHIIAPRNHPLHMKFFVIFPDDCECAEFVRNLTLRRLELTQEYDYERAVNILIKELENI